MLTSCNASPKSSRTQVGEPDRSLDRHIKQTHESTASKSTMRKVRQVPIHMLAKRLSSGKGRVRRGREEGGETPRMTRNDGIELFPTERLLDMLRILAPNHVQERFNASSSICTCHIVTSTDPDALLRPCSTQTKPTCRPRTARRHVTTPKLLGESFKVGHAECFFDALDEVP